MSERMNLVVRLSAKIRKARENGWTLNNDLSVVCAELCDEHVDLGEVADRYNWGRLVADVRRNLK